MSIDLSDELIEKLNAPVQGRLTILSYVDSGGQPHISIRNSIHLHSRDQVAFWVRDSYVGTMTPGAQVGESQHTPSPTPRESGVLTGIEKNPLVSLLYREGRSTYVFSGRAHVETDPAVRDVIFSNMVPSEQGHSTSPSGERTGTAVIVDLDHVVGGSLGDGGVIASHVEMSR